MDLDKMTVAELTALRDERRAHLNRVLAAAKPQYGVIALLGGNEIAGPLEVLLDMLAHADVTLHHTDDENVFNLGGDPYVRLTVTDKNTVMDVLR